MRCPNCGAEMKEGSLYCYECGEDIHIVPDYDPNLDIQIDDPEEDDSEEIEEYRTRSHKRKKELSTGEQIKFTVQIVTLLVLIFVVAFFTLKLWKTPLGSESPRKDLVKIQSGGNEEYELENGTPKPRIPVPKFSYDEGYYNEIVPLKLNVDADNCKIYYTIDGSDPREKGKLYRDTIFLDNGTHEIRAVCLADNARYSEEVSKIYQIEILIIEGPEVPLVSGDYSRPQKIEVTLEDDSQHVVYTTDGSDPTPFSPEYTEPISMPLGPSQFKFAFVDEEGTLSEITTRDYRLAIPGGYSLPDAKALLYKSLFENGKRVEGYYADEGYGVYRYVYADVLTINNMDYYEFDEILVRTNDVTGPTERYYVVHVTSGKIYFLEKHADGSYRLVELSEIYG